LALSEDFGVPCFYNGNIRQRSLLSLFRKAMKDVNRIFKFRDIDNPKCAGKGIKFNFNHAGSPFIDGFPLRRGQALLDLLKFIACPPFDIKQENCANL
jgi:hypothetical protein